MQDEHVAFATPAEFLSTTAAKFNGATSLIVTVRVDPTENFESVNLALSPQQGRRLLDDLTNLFNHSKLLQNLADPDFESRRAYEKIMEDEPISNEGMIHE